MPSQDSTQTELSRESIKINHTINAENLESLITNSAHIKTLIVLGKGAQGQVYGVDCPYFSFVVKSFTGNSKINDLNTELKFYKKIREKIEESTETSLTPIIGHKNILKFYGAVRKEHSYLILEKLDPCKLDDRLDIDLNSIIDTIKSTIIKKFNNPETNVLTKIEHEFPVPIEFLCSLVYQTITGLKFLQETCGIVHCDVKPGNILVSRSEKYFRNDRIKIFDFGNSLEIGEEVKKSTGTRYFMSPEMDSMGQDQSDKIIDHRTDVWSLGATFLCAFLMTLIKGTDEQVLTFSKFNKVPEFTIREEEDDDDNDGHDDDTKTCHVNMSLQTKVSQRVNNFEILVKNCVNCDQKIHYQNFLKLVSKMLTINLAAVDGSETRPTYSQCQETDFYKFAEENCSKSEADFEGGFKFINKCFKIYRDRAFEEYEEESPTEVDEGRQSNTSISE